MSHHEPPEGPPTLLLMGVVFALVLLSFLSAMCSKYIPTP